MSPWRRRSDEDEQDADAVARWDAFQTMLGDAQQPKQDDAATNQPNGIQPGPPPQLTNGGWSPPAAPADPGSGPAAPSDVDSANDGDDSADPPAQPVEPDGAQTWPSASVAEPTYGWPPQQPAAWPPPAPIGQQQPAPGPWQQNQPSQPSQQGQPSQPWQQAGHPTPGSLQQPPAPYPPQPQPPYPAQQPYPAPAPHYPPPHQQQPYPQPPHPQQRQPVPEQQPQQNGPPPAAQPPTGSQPQQAGPPARQVDDAPPKPPETPPFVWTDAFQTGSRGIPSVKAGLSGPAPQPTPAPPQQQGRQTGSQPAVAPQQAGTPQTQTQAQGELPPAPTGQLPTPFQLAGPSSPPPATPGGIDELSAETLIGRRAKNSGGWRKAVSTISVRPGHARAEQRRRELIAQATVPVHGCYRIAVISLKGGVGKTTSTVCIGATLASLRGDRVIAVDANPDRGTLSGKIPLQTTATVRNLLNDADHIQAYSDVRRYTSQSPDRLEVLASESDPSVSLAFGEEDYRRVARVLERFYNVVLTDCGTGLLHSAMAGVLALADQIVVVSSGSVDGARSASATLDWLEAHGYSQLVAGGLAVINSVRPKSGGVNIDALESHFAARCRSVTRIPYDPHLELGAEVDLAELSQSTRDALLELAAQVTTGFPTQQQPPSVPYQQYPFAVPQQQEWPGPAAAPYQGS